MADTPTPIDDFAAAPTVVSDDDFVITDGGQIRETAEELRHTLSHDTPADVAPGDETPPGERIEHADGSVESTGAGSAKAEKAEKATEAVSKPKRTVEGRVAELQKEIATRTREKHDTIRERDAAAKELADIRAQLAASREQARPGFPRDTPVVPADAAAAPATLPKKPVWKEYDDAGKDWDVFNDDLEAYRDARAAASEGVVKGHFAAELARVQAEAVARVESIEARAAEATINAGLQARVDAVKASTPDFATAMADLRAAGVEQTPFMRDVVRMHPKGADLLYALGKNVESAAILQSLDFSTVMFDAIMESDDPTAVLLHLAESSETFEQIRSLDSASAGRRIAALDARLSSSSSPEPRASGSRRSGTTVSRAATPIRPVGASSKASVVDDEDDEGESFESWMSRENKRDADHGRR